MIDQQYLSVGWFRYLGVGVVTLWMTLYGMLWREILRRLPIEQHRQDMEELKEFIGEKLKSKEDIDAIVREALDTRMRGIDKRLDEIKTDNQFSEKRLSSLIYDSEVRIMHAIDKGRL